MPSLKTLSVAAVFQILIIILTQLHLMELVRNLFTWVCAAMLACAVIWGWIILADAQRGKTNYRHMSWEASPDIFVTRKNEPGKFHRLILYKLLLLLFILALSAAFVLHGLGLFLASP